MTVASGEILATGERPHRRVQWSRVTIGTLLMVAGAASINVSALYLVVAVLSEDYYSELQSIIAAAALPFVALVVGSLLALVGTPRRVVVRVVLLTGAVVAGRLLMTVVVGFSAFPASLLLSPGGGSFGFDGLGDWLAPLIWLAVLGSVIVAPPLILATRGRIGRARALRYLVDASIAGGAIAIALGASALWGVVRSVCSQLAFSAELRNGVPEGLDTGDEFAVDVYDVGGLTDFDWSLVWFMAPFVLVSLICAVIFGGLAVAAARRWHQRAWLSVLALLATVPSLVALPAFAITTVELVRYGGLFAFEVLPDDSPAPGGSLVTWDYVLLAVEGVPLIVFAAIAIFVARRALAELVPQLRSPIRVEPTHASTGSVTE